MGEQKQTDSKSILSFINSLSPKRTTPISSTSSTNSLGLTSSSSSTINGWNCKQADCGHFNNYEGAAITICLRCKTPRELSWVCYSPGCFTTNVGTTKCKTCWMTDPMAAQLYFEERSRYEFFPQDSTIYRGLEPRTDAPSPQLSQTQHLRLAIEEYARGQKLQPNTSTNIGASTINYGTPPSVSQSQQSRVASLIVWTCASCNRYNHYSQSSTRDSITCSGCNGPFSPKPPTNFAETIVNEDAEAAKANLFKAGSRQYGADESQVDRGLVIKIDSNSSLEVLQLRQKAAILNGWLGGRCTSCSSNLDLDGVCSACQMRLQFPLSVRSAHSAYQL